LKYGERKNLLKDVSNADDKNQVHVEDGTGSSKATGRLAGLVALDRSGLKLEG
jgi:hypothetical protein